MDNAINQREVVSIGQMARRLGVPARWLCEQIEAGRVPALRAGRRCWLVEPGAVTIALARLAANGKPAAAPPTGGRP